MAMPLGWIADGIERAERCGGVALEVYRRPGFTGGGKSVRVVRSVQAEGFEVEADPDPYDEEDDLAWR